VEITGHAAFDRGRINARDARQSVSSRRALSLALAFELGGESEKRCDRWIAACGDRGGQMTALLGLV
jgi:hypothetical protein